MADNVVGIRPGEVPEVTPPDNDVTRLLEDLLVKARAGELRGVAVACVEGIGDGCSLSTAWRGLPWTRWPLGTAVGLLQYRYMEALADRR